MAEIRVQQTRGAGLAWVWVLVGVLVVALVVRYIAGTRTVDQPMTPVAPAATPMPTSLDGAEPAILRAA